jgi:hypothetical protein
MHELPGVSEGPGSTVPSKQSPLYSLGERANSSEAIAADEPAAERFAPPRPTASASAGVPAPHHLALGRSLSNETSNGHDNHTLPQPTIWNRIAGRVKQALKRLNLTSTKSTSVNIWEKNGTVVILVGRHDESRSAIIMYDSGSEFNLISTSFLETFNMSCPPSTGVDFAISVTGGETFKSLGEIEVRWHDPSYRMRHRFQRARCHVVESEHIELLLGKNDIDRLKLFKPNRGLIGTLRAKRPKVQGKLGLVALDIMATNTL